MSIDDVQFNKIKEREKVFKKKSLKTHGKDMKLLLLQLKNVLSKTVCVYSSGVSA